MKTVEKAFDILEIIMNKGHSMTVAEISKLSGVNSSSICRLCSFLASRDYLYQSTKRGPYSLGSKFMQFNDVPNLTMKLKNKAFPILEKLSRKTNENVLMAVQSGLEVFTILVIYPSKVIQAYSREGDRVPLFCSGAGKIFLANQNIAKTRQILSKIEVKAYTPNTITDLNKLLEEIVKIKKEGFSFNNEEYEKGLRSVSAPIKDNTGKVIAAVSIVGPSITLTKEKIISLVPVIKDCASAISKSLGDKED